MQFHTKNDFIETKFKCFWFIISNGLSIYVNNVPNYAINNINKKPLHFVVMNTE